MLPEVRQNIQRKKYERRKNWMITLPMKRDVLYRYLERQPVEHIAELYHVTTTHIRRILNEDDIMAERARVEALMTQHVGQRLEHLMGEAIDTIRDTLRGDNTNELRLKGAVKVLEHARSMQKKSDDGDVVKDIGAAVIRELGKQMTVKLEDKPLEATTIDVTPVCPECGGAHVDYMECKRGN